MAEQEPEPTTADELNNPGELEPTSFSNSKAAVGPVPALSTSPAFTH